MKQPFDNPLLPGMKVPASNKEKEPDTLAVDIDDMTAETTIGRKLSPQAKHKRLMRGENARQAIRQFDQETELFGFTKGQFSLIQLLQAVLEKTGPGKVDIVTWTANSADIGEVDRLKKQGMVTQARWVMDRSSQRRHPQFVGAVRECFGDAALRMTNIHATFITIRNAEWDVTIRTSMNLNHNPRFEDFTLTNSEELADFLEAIVDDIYKRPAKKQETDAYKAL